MTIIPQVITSVDAYLESPECIYEDQINHHSFDVFVFFIATIDPEGNISFLNKRAKELLGSKDNELIGKSFVNILIITEEQGKIKSAFREIFYGYNPGSDTIRYEIINLNNQRRIIDAKNVKIVDQNQNIKGILITGKDLTEYIFTQQNLQKDIYLYRALLNNIPEINIFMFDKEMRFLLAEGVEMKNMGLDSGSLEGKSLFEIPNEVIKKIWAPLFQKAIKGQKTRKEYTFNNLSYLIRLTPLLNSKNEIGSAIAITRNITGEKLTKKILNKSREEAEKSERLKSNFLANVSHEIRTPLNAIMGFTEQLMQSDLSDLQRKYVEIIEKSSEYLLSLINDVLVLSKIEANQVSFNNKPFSIKSVIEYVYKAIIVRAEEKNLSFTYEISEKLEKILIGDSLRLQQILMNLITNAVKFTNIGSVRLLCYPDKETITEINVKFDIIDTGIGISSKDLKKIFKQYTRVGSVNVKRNEGSGLGLAICKNLIRLQNGSLSVSSQKGVGTTFSFSIPYSKGKETDLPAFDPENIDPVRFKNKKVILIDDDKLNLLLVNTMLEKFHCSIDMAKNGVEAISKLDIKRYDIMLLDIHMPGISGIEVAKYLRDKKKDEKCKIIAITAAALKDDIKKYKEAGINDFLIKPFKEISLYNKMCEVMQLKMQRVSKPGTEIILMSEQNPRSYNLFDLKKMANNDEAFIIKALQTFIENSEIAVKNFKDLLEEENWKEIGEIAHRILPSFRHLEVDKVIPKLIEIKTKTLIKFDVTEARELIEETIDEIEKVIDDMTRETNKLKDLY